MADFAAVLELSSLDGSNGFQLSGVAASDYAGISVSAAGDINHDGIDDFMVSAYRNDTAGSESGATYVVFGTTGGFPANISLGALNGADGFRISGGFGHQSGDGLAGRGDINGDGIDDLVIGARRADALGNYTGSTYVVYGKDTDVDGSFAAAISLTTLNGTTGFRMSGQQDGEANGRSNAIVGDFNGDGFDDVLSGSGLFDVAGRANSGVSYLLFGSDEGFAPSFSWSTLNGTNGFRIDGAAANHQSGTTVGGGDFNGDGLADLIIGFRAGGDGGAYIVFGHTGPMAPVFDSATLDGVNGFVITGPGGSFGRSVNGAGDINGDGFDDVIIGAYTHSPGGLSTAGSAYVVFGTAGAPGASFSASALNGTNGFRIDGEFVSGAVGLSVSAAGDINGDGLGDLLVGSERLDINGTNSGGAYVVFGRSDGFAPTLALSSLDGTNGFQINGELAGDALGHAGGVSAAGDVNGDGYDDLLVGARTADPNGGNSGAAYVIFGRRVAETFIGTAANDTSNGSSQADDLSGGDGNDVLSGMGGADELDGGALSDILFGGDGADDLIGGGGGDILYGDAGDDAIDGGEGADKLFGGDGLDTLTGGLGNDRFDAGAGVDSLDGGDGNDLIDGGLGADAMTGGLGNDIFVVDDLFDTTLEAVGEGFDIVRTAQNGWTLAENVEGLELQGSAAIDGSGNGGANNLQGNAGTNTLSGLAGVDTINGNDGDDFIIGGTGNDLLRGGLGADTFVVAHAFGALLETDQVYDFSAAEGDILDLSGAYAGTLELVSSFSKEAGQMTLTFAGGITTLRLDVTGDGKVDYQMKINGDVTGESGDWLL